MRITNTSWVPDYEAKLLIEFALGYVEKVSGRPLRLGLVRLTNCQYAYRGRAWWGGATLLRIGRPTQYPVSARYRDYKDFFEYQVNDYREGIVMLAAHEFWHHARWQNPDRATGTGRKGMEHDCECVGSDAIDAFRKVRADLDARIAARLRKAQDRERDADMRARIKNSPEGKLAKLTADEKRWVRKWKLANTKLKSIRRKKINLLKKIEAINSEPEPLMQAANGGGQ